MTDAINQGFVNSEINNGIATIEFGHPLSNSLPGKILRKLANTITDIGNDDSVVQSKFVLQNAQLDSQAFSQGLDDNETVDLTFSAQIGGPTTTDQGLFYSGAFDGVIDATGATNSYDIS